MWPSVNGVKFKKKIHSQCSRNCVYYLLLFFRLKLWCDFLIALHEVLPYPSNVKYLVIESISSLLVTAKSLAERVSFDSLKEVRITALLVRTCTHTHTQQNFDQKTKLKEKISAFKRSCINIIYKYIYISDGCVTNGCVAASVQTYSD